MLFYFGILKSVTWYKYFRTIFVNCSKKKKEVYEVKLSHFFKIILHPYNELRIDFIRKMNENFFNKKLYEKYFLLKAFCLK